MLSCYFAVFISSDIMTEDVGDEFVLSEDSSNISTYNVLEDRMDIPPVAVMPPLPPDDVQVLQVGNYDNVDNTFQSTSTFLWSPIATTSFFNLY